MIDLHTHTTASDGTSSAEELVMEAAAAGVKVLAVTDHDTFASVDAARMCAQDRGIRLIAGVELSTSLDAEAQPLFQATPRDIHLLAYFPNGDIPAPFRNWVFAMEESRWERNRLLLVRLEEQGITIAEAELRAAGGSIAGRVHLARILQRRKLVHSLDEAFHRYLGEHASSYVPRQSPPLGEALASIREAGGLSSLAHPIRFWGSNWQAADALCGWFAGRGLHALEVWHSEQDAAYSGHLRELALRHRLRMTGGSDFHGGNKPGIALGTGYHPHALVPVQELQTSWEGAEVPLL